LSHFWHRASSDFITVAILIRSVTKNIKDGGIKNIYKRRKRENTIGPNEIHICYRNNCQQLEHQKIKDDETVEKSVNQNLLVLRLPKRNRQIITCK
jgi:hypothetical protein